MNPILRLALSFTLTIGVTLGACASAGDSARTGPRGGSTLISNDEIRASNAGSALELVQTARPGWLRKQGAVSLRMDGEVLVYLDDARLGGIDALHSLQLSGIHSIRFLDAVAASARFGLSHPHGAIQVRSRASP